MDVCVWDAHQDTYLDIWVGWVIIIWCQDNNLLCCSTNLAIPLVLPQLHSTGFTSDFQFYDYYTIPVHILPSTCILSHLSPALIWSYYESSLLDIICCISTWSCMLVLTTRFSMHIYDLDLSIYMCLSQHAIWLSHHYSSGSSDSSGSSCPGFRSLERVDSLSCWSEWRSWSVDPQQTVQSPILSGPLCVSRVFLL